MNSFRYKTMNAQKNEEGHILITKRLLKNYQKNYKMKPKDDEYIYDNFVLKKLTSNNLDEVKPEDIAFEDELK